jgi:site-specific recombinase XerC
VAETEIAASRPARRSLSVAHGPLSSLEVEARLSRGRDAWPPTSTTCPDSMVSAGLARGSHRGAQYPAEKAPIQEGRVAEQPRRVLRPSLAAHPKPRRRRALDGSFGPIARAFLTWLVGEGLLPANPATNIRGPKEKRVNRRALPQEDVERLLAAQPLREQVGLMCLAWLGLRKDELRQLRLGDFNLAANTVRVHGKGGHVDVLPVGFQRLRGALELHLVVRSGGADEFLLYPKQARTRPMDRTTIHRWFKRCLERAGMPQDIQLHELRYTAAQALYEISDDIVLAQELLRHGDIRTTRGYLRGSLERLRAAQEALEASWK